MITEIRDPKSEGTVHFSLDVSGTDDDHSLAIFVNSFGEDHFSQITSSQNGTEQPIDEISGWPICKAMTQPRPR